MKITLVGVSHWHAKMHLDAVKAAGATPLSVWDPDAVKAAAFGEDNSCEVAGTFEEVLVNRPDLAIVMGTPAEMADRACNLIELGVPILIEKPVGVSGPKLKPLVDTAGRKNAFVAVALAHSYSPLLSEFRRLRDDDRIGRVSHCQFRLINGPPQRYVDDGCGWVLDPAVSGGGALRNLGIHGVNAFLDIVGGQEVSVEAAAFGPKLHGAAVEDFAHVVLRARDGTLGTIDAGYTYASMNTGIFDWRVSTSNASFYDNGNQVDVATLDDGEIRSVEATPVAKRYDLMMANTLEQLARGRPPAVSLQQHWRAMEIIDRCYETAGIGN